MSVPCVTTLLPVFVLGWCCDPAEVPKPIHVTVVAILASDRDDTIDPRLKDLAEEVRQNLDPRWTGFRIACMHCQSLAPGASGDFPLPCSQTVKVTVEGMGRDDRVRVKVAPPMMREVCYTCSCGAFMPIVTSYRTRGVELLILAVRVQPCQKGK